MPVDFQAGAGPGEAVAVPIPVDHAKVPWTMRLEGGTAKVCRLEG